MRSRRGRCIRNHKTPLINLRWHKETILAMLGCYESIQSGKIAKVGGLFRKARR